MKYMARPEKSKKYLVDEYKSLVKYLSKKGYDNTQIGFIMNRNKSSITRILKEKNKLPDWLSKLT